MGPTRKRVLAYGFSTLLVGGLTYLGFFYEAAADPITLLSSVDIQIRLASVMPETNREGGPLETRVRMLREVRSNLDRVEAQLPNFAPAREYRAFLAFLDGDHLAAAGHYRALRAAQSLRCLGSPPDGCVANRMPSTCVPRRARNSMVVGEKR